MNVNKETVKAIVDTIINSYGKPSSTWDNLIKSGVSEEQLKFHLLYLHDHDYFTAEPEIHLSSLILKDNFAEFFNHARLSYFGWQYVEGTNGATGSGWLSPSARSRRK